MFQGVLLGLVLVSVAECLQQRFIELPFDGDKPLRNDFADQQHFEPFRQAAPSHRFAPSHHETPNPTFPSPSAPVHQELFASVPPRRFPSHTRGTTRHFTTSSQPPLPIFHQTPAQQKTFEDTSLHLQPTLTEQDIDTLNNVSPTQKPEPNQFFFDQARRQPSPLFTETQPHRSFFSIEEPSLRPAQPNHQPHIRRPQHQAPRFVPPQHQAPARFAPQPQAPARFAQPQPQSQFIINEQPTFQERSQPVPVQSRFQSATFGTDKQNNDYEERLFREQAANAKYSFASQIDDSISGNQHNREEVRDGLAVKGKYSYSDGYVKRTVFYEADDQGYRVVKQEEEPLGDGPQVNPNGKANVSTYVAGNTVQYSITAADIQDPQKSILPQTQQLQRPLRRFS